MRKGEVLGRRKLLDDVFEVHAAGVRFERFDRTLSPPVRRLVLERGDSVAAVVRDRDSCELRLTEQFRYPTHDRGPGWLVELIAGAVERDASPSAALARALEEQLGFCRYERRSTVHPSPGASSERVWLFFVEVGKRSQGSAGGGAAAEHEDIRIVRWNDRDAERALSAGGVHDCEDDDRAAVVPRASRAGRHRRDSRPKTSRRAEAAFGAKPRGGTTSFRSVQARSRPRVNDAHAVVMQLQYTAAP